jgi:hypothetical protein
MRRPQLVHEGDRLFVYRIERCFRVTELFAPIGARAPRGALQNEADPGRFRYLDVPLIVAPQSLPASRIAQQIEGGEMGKLQSLEINQSGLDARVRQKEGAVELGQAPSIMAHECLPFVVQWLPQACAAAIGSTMGGPGRTS